MSETKVKCPKCGTIRSIIGTEDRVRCANRGDCGHRYYTKKNLVPIIRTPLKIDQTFIDTFTDPDGNITLEGPRTGILAGLDETSDFKRLIWLAVTGVTWRGTNAELDRRLKEKIDIIREL